MSAPCPCESALLAPCYRWKNDGAAGDMRACACHDTANPGLPS